MSQDLFAAFGDPPQEASSKSHQKPGDNVWVHSSAGQHVARSDSPIVSNTGRIDLSEASGRDEGGSEDDDFGDFEDASATSSWDEPKGTMTAASTTVAQTKPAANLPFTPKVEASTQDSRIGKHPFAGHMDFLFEPGEDEYDAGEDDLANLAKDPEAAMAFSKRIIAEQEAKARTTGNGAGAGARTAQVNTAAVKKTQKPVTKLQSEPRNPVPKAAPKAKSAPPTQPSLPSSPSSTRRKLQKKSGYVPAKDPNVLFDVDNLSEHDEDEDDDDDFGDFEDGVKPAVEVVEPDDAPVQQLTPAMASMDLLGFDDNLMPITQIGRSRADSLRKADEILGPSKPRSSSLIDDGGWDDFDPQPPAEKAARVANDVKPQPEEEVWDDFESSEPIAQPAANTTAARQLISSTSSSVPVSQSALPPTNIPPPVVLLSVFPSILSSAQEALFNPLSRLDQAQKQQLLAHAASQQFLRAHLDVAIVLARIIAGRKSRWKRDQILSQSMRIGQAGAGGKSGMKLTGVDRSEATKEEQEALEAIRLWKAQAGKLRGAVTAASAVATSKLPPIPEISEQMPVKVLKAVEGGFTAPHACALCGLKREERVVKVDVDVNDSFGEWWVQGMDMHLACRRWWDEHKGKLKSR